MKTRPYVGIKPGGKREVFRASAGPTEELYGTLYNAVVGPFKTLRGAKYCASFGGNNPHIQCVNDAERIAKFQCQSTKTNKIESHANE